MSNHICKRSWQAYDWHLIGIGDQSCWLAKNPTSVFFFSVQLTAAAVSVRPDCQTRQGVTWAVQGTTLCIVPACHECCMCPVWLLLSRLITTSITSCWLSVCMSDRLPSCTTICLLFLNLLPRAHHPLQLPCGCLRPKLKPHLHMPFKGLAECAAV